jgi:hypothetical protein
VPELWLPSLTGLGARVSARSQMRPTQRLTAVVSKLSTVRMIDELSLKSHTRVTGPFWDKASELDEFAAFSRLAATVLRLVASEGFTLSPR